MSETTNCEDCGRPFELHRKFLSSDTKSYCHIPDTRHWYVPKPAEPVIEVAPGEPTCEYCGPVCYGGAAHNARVEDGYKWSEGKPAAIPAPAVPAQEAPRERREIWCTCKHTIWVHGPEGCGSLGCKCEQFDPRLAEPQAGAQVPSQDEIGSILVAAIDRHITDESLRDLAVIAANGIYWRNQRIGKLEAHLNSIKSYATEAAKTPITREDMHDPLKAQTFWDEAKGFERLVLSEITPKEKA
jgi:hypothetical protein